MRMPIVHSWVEQSDEIASQWIVGALIGAFHQIAKPASQAKVVQGILALMLERPNVLNVKPSGRRLALQQAAILTTASRSLPHLLTRFAVHESSPRRLVFQKVASLGLEN
jgi:hypothetical protein